MIHRPALAAMVTVADGAMGTVKAPLTVTAKAAVTGATPGEVRSIGRGGGTSSPRLPPASGLLVAALRNGMR